MLVSVIIPTYNSEIYILKAINSVLSQTYQNFEIIVVDDGSVDNTKKIVESIKNSKIEYIYQKNSGASSARNKGISLAKGEFIAFLDADDEWYPIKLEKQVEILKKNNTIGLNFCSIEKTSATGKFLYIKKYKDYKNHKDIMKSLLLESFDNIVYPSTVILRKSLINKTKGFDARIIIAEDRDLWLNMGFMTIFSCLNEPLVKHKKVNTSLTNTINIKKHHKSYLISLNKFFKLPDLPDDLKKLKNKAYSSMYLELGILSLLKNNYDFSLKKVLSYVLKSHKEDPTGFMLEYRKVKFLIRILVNIAIYPVLKRVF